MAVRGRLAADITGDIPAKFWNDCLPEKSVCAVAGPSGVGKSLIVSTITADISRTVGTVIYGNNEDDPVIQRCRLEAAGADMQKVVMESFNIVTDLDDLAETVMYHKAKFVVFDTAQKHMGIPMQRWDIPLKELASLCQKLDFTAMLVHHTNKSVAKNADWRSAIGGSTAGLTGTARSIALIGQRPDNPSQVLYCPVKDSNDETPLAIAYEFDTEDFDQSDGRTVSVAYMIESERDIKVVNKTALVFVQGSGDGKRGPAPEQAAAAAEFLTDLLAHGPVAVNDHILCSTNPLGVGGDCGLFHADHDGACPDCGGPTHGQLGIKSLASESEVSFGTAKRAKAALTIESSRKMDKHSKGGKRSVVFWRLPDGHPSLIPNAPVELPGTN